MSQFAVFVSRDIFACQMHLMGGMRRRFWVFPFSSWIFFLLLFRREDWEKALFFRNTAEGPFGKEASLTLVIRTLKKSLAKVARVDFAHSMAIYIILSSESATGNVGIIQH